MTKHDAASLENWFKKLARARIRAKERGDQRYSGDAGYWDGGRCDWGANHSLNEDCHTLEKAFNKISSLGDIKKELLESTSKEEFDAKKRNLIRKCEEALNGLDMKIGTHTIMFGICIIWDDYTNDLEKEKRSVKKEVEKARTSLEKETYKWAQEIKMLELEQSQIEKQMKENERKAKNETDPAQKALLIQLIEEDGKKLKRNFEKQKELNSRFNIDPAKKVQDLIEKMKKVINKGGEGNGNNDEDDDNSGEENNQPNNGDEEEDENTEPSGNNSRRTPKKKKQNQPNFFQNNQQLVMIATLAALVIFYLMNQKSEKEPNYYDF